MFARLDSLRGWLSHDTRSDEETKAAHHSKGADGQKSGHRRAEESPRVGRAAS